MSLRDPKGRVIDSKVAEDDNKSEYLELGFADFASYVLTDTLPGPWSIVLSADPKNAASSQYVAYASLASLVRLEVHTDRPWYRPGEQVTISATLAAAGTGAVLSEVQVVVYSPSKKPTTLPLRPALTDTLKGTGATYVGSFPAPAQGGVYVGLVRALGQEGKWPLERGAEVTFGVYGDGARLSGAYALELDQAEGELRGLKATIAVSVKREGEYLCFATLVDRFGQRVTTVAHPVHLGPGEHSIALPLPGQAIADSGREGPYHLGEVILSDVSGAAVLLDVAENVGPSVKAQPQDLTGASASSP